MRKDGNGDMKTDMPNIIVVVADALRADHLSCYGYHRRTSAHIDEFAEQCVLFESAFSASPTTISSIPSILTGLYPSLHGTGVDGNLLTLNLQRPTIPQVLKRYGYTTVAFNTNPLVAGKYGYDRGCDERFDMFPSQSEKLITCTIKHSTNGIERAEVLRFHRPYVCSAAVNSKVGDWLAHNRRQPFFMWIHYMDTHAPYYPRDPYFSRYSADRSPMQILNFLRRFGDVFDRLHKGTGPLTVDQKELVVNCYDSEIGYFDQNFGLLLRLLSNRGLLDDTVIFLTADHGEEFWEHGAWGHFVRMYDFNLHVPLLMKCPGLSPVGRRISKQVRNIDIFPTILDLLDIAPQQELSGVSLLPYIDEPDSAAELPVVSEGGGVVRLSTGELIDRLYAIRTPDYKYIRNVTTNEAQLYRLKEDAMELNNAANQAGVEHIISDLERQMHERLGRGAVATSRPEQPDFDEQMLERLKVLGYA